MNRLRHEGLRWRAAKLAAAAAALKRQSGADASFSLAFMTDASRAPHPELIARVLPEGAAIILRDYEMSGRAGLAAQLKSICSRRGVKLLIGADPGLAKHVGADGVHYPAWFEPKTPRRYGLIITASCHNVRELERAQRLNADLTLLSPAFPTESHPCTSEIGPAAFGALAAASASPVLALGGVTAENAHKLRGPNIAGIAAIGAFLG